MNLYGPIALIVLSNVLYHVCAKSAPPEVHPLASLTLTYATAAVVSGLLYLVLSRGGSLLEEYRHVNASVFLLGAAVVGLEAGFLLLYKAGWEISTGQLICSALLAVCLLAVGCLFYHEPLSASKVLGVVICMAGLYFLNR
jgi:drug/metabolite transporter (DMT)-like permease